MSRAHPAGSAGVILRGGARDRMWARKESLKQRSQHQEGRQLWWAVGATAFLSCLASSSMFSSAHRHLRPLLGPPTPLSHHAIICLSPEISWDCGVLAPCFFLLVKKVEGHSLGF